MDISVIIPTFRPKDYLWACLTSLEKQTLRHDCFEVLLILNGEEEPYRHLIDEFLIKNPGLPCRLIYNKESGVSLARNRGLDEAKGEYICFMDDDDIITECYLEELYRLASRDTVPLSYITAFEDDTADYRPLYISQDYKGPHCRTPFVSARRYFYVPYCKLLHRDIIGTRRFDPSLRNGEDALFMFLISDRMHWVRFTGMNAEYRYRQRITSAFNISRSASYHIGNMIRCQYKATRIFLSHPTRYSLVFYIKYILATIMGCYRHVCHIKQ